MSKGDFSTTTTAQDEVDQALWYCMASMYNACEIVDWGFRFVDVESTDRSHMPGNATLFNTKPVESIARMGNAANSPGHVLGKEP